jgi:hypothetical protein
MTSPCCQCGTTPFRLDTPANHRDGLWLADTIASMGLTDVEIHLRGTALPHHRTTPAERRVVPEQQQVLGMAPKRRR